MIRSTLFVDPHGSNLADVRRILSRATDLALAARIGRRHPGLPASPTSTPIPHEPRSDDEVLEDLASLIAASTRPADPDFLAHMGAVSSVMSIAGDLVAACLNNNLIALELSPAMSLLEQDLTRQLAVAFGLGPDSGGVITTGGSLSNLHALVVARNAVLGTRDQGIHTLDRPPVFFASEAAHASVIKGAMIAGLGAEGAIAVRTGADGALDLDDLHVRYEAALAAGQAPFAVVATAGTTVTGSIDPISELGAFARSRGLWFHVDAAWAGGLLFSPALRSRLDGIDAADSVTFCPQKLLLVGLSSSVVLFRDMPAMERAFRTSFPYVDRREDFVNRCEIGVQGSRPAEVLKLWLTLHHVGWRCHGELVDRWVGLADAVAAEVRRRSYLTLACAPRSGIVCFRGVPDWMAVEDHDAWTAALHAVIATDTGIRLSLVPYCGARWMRAVFANPFVERSVVDRLFVAIDGHATKRPCAV